MTAVSADTRTRFGVRWQAQRDTALDRVLTDRLGSMAANTPKTISWPHAPLHELSAVGTYFLTAGPYLKEHYFRGAERLKVLQRGLLSVARLNYVHQNPVKHGLVTVANQYPWCSAGWFERTAKAAQVRTIYGFKTDKLKILDEYDTLSEW